MKIAPEHQKDFDAMPTALQKLLTEELKSGNKIVEVSHCFPAPPAGAYFKLAKHVKASRRKSTRWVSFYDRGGSTYSGEFTDAKRFYFILEPPNPPKPVPTMDEIRAEREAKQRAADEALYKKQAKLAKSSRRKVPDLEPDPLPTPTQNIPVPSAAKDESALGRFRASMTMDYEKWHDGIGYDLEILKTAMPEELVEIENLLVTRSVDDWRDVEALAALDSPRARALLRKTLKTGKTAIRTAVTSYAPNLVTDDERTTALVASLEGTEVYGGLTQALLQVEEFHPPKVIEALFRGALNRDGSTATHFAAMLMFVHGKATSSFDWDQRPFFLRFNTENRKEREEVFRELGEKIGVDVTPYFKSK